MPYAYDIFLSHNHADQEWTAQLAARIEQENWQGRKLKVFFSPWDIRPGQSIPKEIQDALPKSCKVGFVLSPEAVNSAWVELELFATIYATVSERSERAIPLHRRTCEAPTLLKPILGIDFRDDAKFEDSYQRLLAVIKDEPLPRGSLPRPKAAPALSLRRPPITGFVARRDKDGRDLVERLKEELAPSKHQLVTLWGSGGVGKTTLALEATQAMADVFSERIVWTGPQERADFAFTTLLDEIATQLGRADLRPLAPEPKAEQVSALIAAAPTLIVLDNFETITPDEQQRCVEWMQRAPCPALITTRDKINAARSINIEAMSQDEAREFLKRLIKQAHDLSVDSSIFAVLDHDRIIQTAEANPLVLEWVVAQIADDAQEPQTVLNALAQGEGDAAQRVFDRSFNLPQLGDDGRAVLLALSLFVPSASRAALAEVAGFGNDAKRLNEAVGRSARLWLVKTKESNQRLIVDGLTREVTKAHLARHQSADEFRRRFVVHFLRYAEAHARTTAEDLDALEREKDNVLAAMDLAFGLKDWQSVMQMMDAIGNGLLWLHGYWDEAILRGMQAIEAARNAQSEVSIARFAHNAAIIYQNRGELAEARRLYEQSLEIEKALGNQSGIASSLHELGRLAQAQGELAEARRLYEQSLEINKALGNQSGIASSLHQLGRLAQAQGELAEARRLYEQSLEINKALGRQSSIATSLHQLGRLAQDQGELAEARRLYEQSLEISKALGNQSSIASSLHELGRLAQAQGELAEARRLYEQSLEISKALGNQSSIALTLGQLGLLSEEEGNNTEAARLLREALSIFEKLKSPNAKIARQNLERVEGKASKRKPKSTKRKRRT